MMDAFRQWRLHPAHRGVFGVMRFWFAVLVDVARSATPQRLVALSARWSRRGDRNADRPPYGWAVLAGIVVFALYAKTLAPTVAFWDAGEYITVAHLLGIPHPPGNPLFVLLARTWDILLAPTGLVPAVRINLFSAAASATAHALWFLVAERALRGCTPDAVSRRWGAAAAVALSATAFTVWNQSDVNEKVYTLSLFTVALTTWLAFRWRDTGRRPRTLLLITYLVALTATNHLMGVLVAPALVLFILMTEPTVLRRPRLWAAGAGLAAIALSVHFLLPIRAELRPLISETEPTCETVAGAVASVYTWGGRGCEALSATLQREQYGKPSITVDPNDPASPRSAALLGSQLANYLQYWNWQWARSLGGTDPLFGGGRALVTLLVVLLGVFGARVHWRSDRAGAAYLGTLWLTLSLGLVLYLNFRYGFALERLRFPDAAMHEVRERDYFFLIGFSVWGVWAGVGLGDVWRRVSAVLAGRVRVAPLAAAPVLVLALLPLALNWKWASRADDYTARDWAYNVLMSVKPYGVLVTNGDNDTFPLWYLQEVEGVRKDVTIMVSSYLNTPWYVKQLRELTRPCATGVDPAEQPTRVICQRTFDEADLPAPLLAAGWAEVAEPPTDTILPLSDDEIDRIAESYFVTQEPLAFRATSLETRIEAGTQMLPAGTFAAAMLQATLGERPVYFMPGAREVNALGLHRQTLRTGLTWEIPAEPLVMRNGVEPLPDARLSPMAGAAVDLQLTDTLLWEVYRHRGRVLDADAPWVDAAVANIPWQYALAHLAAGEGHLQRGGDRAAERHFRLVEWWRGVPERG